MEKTNHRQESAAAIGAWHKPKGKVCGGLSQPRIATAGVPEAGDQWHYPLMSLFVGLCAVLCAVLCCAVCITGSVGVGGYCTCGIVSALSAASEGMESWR